MPRKRAFRLGDEPAPAGIPDRKPPASGRRACEACAVVGPKATVQLCLRRTGRVPGQPLANAASVCQLVRGLEHADRESFYALYLDARHRIVDIDRVAVGSQSGVVVHPRELFKAAMLAGAHAVIAVHNHPSGSPEPSRQDEHLTKQLREAGALVDIPVLDHVIVGSEGCNSLAARGLLGEAHTGTYNPLAGQAPKRKR